MAFNSNDVQDDENFTNHSDPSLSRLERRGGAQVIQDIALNTYWANTVGKTKYPGVYQMYKKELQSNLECLLDSKMTYRQIEEYLNMVGYDSNDIRCSFKKATGIDPVKLEFMRLEDIKAVPGNIPGFNLGWGLSKKNGVESYFVAQDGRGLYVVYAQKNDQERVEEKTFLRHDEALKCLEGLVKDVHRYDMPAKEAVEEAPELDEEEPTSKFYTAIANRFYDLEKKGALATEYVYKTVRDVVTCGNLTEAEGMYLIKKYAGDEVSEALKTGEDLTDDQIQELVNKLGDGTPKADPNSGDVLDNPHPNVDLTLQTNFASRAAARNFLRFIKEDLGGKGRAELSKDAPTTVNWWVELPNANELDKNQMLHGVMDHLNAFLQSPEGNVKDVGEEGVENQAPQRTKIIQAGKVVGEFVRVAANPSPAESVPVHPAHVEDTESQHDDTRKTIKDVQDNTSVSKEVKKRTPQDFFKSTLPNRIEEIATEHIEDVLSYIANRESDIDGFGIVLHSLQYQKHETGKSMGDINPQTGEPSGPPKATISAILEVENKTMSDEKNKKFVLAVFFVNANGQISTSDSVKGEDDIIYGFTQEGFEQYFTKNTKEF